MCITFISLNSNSKYKFVLLFNRDEFFNRETFSIDFNYYYDSHKDSLFFPLDVISGGTFLCLNIKNSKFGCILNNNFKHIPYNPNTKFKRAEIPINFCKLEEENHDKFIDEVNSNKFEYNGFNFIFGNMLKGKVHYYTNNCVLNSKGEVVEHNEAIDIEESIIGLSNCFIHNNETIHSKKVEYGKMKFKEILERDYAEEDEFILDLLHLMQDQSKQTEKKYDIAKIKEEGIAGQYEHVKNYVVSSIFVSDNFEGINLENGTRHTLVVTLDVNNKLKIHEQCDNVLTLTSEKSNNCKPYLTLEKRDIKNIKKFEFQL